ncbi:MAG: PKD domain-containing protein, partial [Chloroflexi bacterium]|nr:PKD domain-containing protein [Chloroflexota bacterium]
RNTIAGNRIFANGGLGIDLFPNGVTLNDPTDADTGANNLQNFPVIGTVNNMSGVLTATGTLTSTASTTFTLHFYSNTACDVTGYGEGQTYLGAITTTTDSAGFTAFTAALPISVPDGESITATATDPAGNTSEFSVCSNPTGYAPISGLQAFNDSPTYLSAPTHFTATVTGGSGISYAWDFGDGFTGSSATIAHSYNSIGTYTASVTATNSGSSAVASTIVTITQPPACAATFNHGATVFASEDAAAVQQAVDAANANDTLRIAGMCAGVAARNGVTQTVYLDKPLTLRGGYSLFDWSTPYPITRPTTFDAQGLSRVIFITNTVPVTLENLIVANGFISGTASACPDYGCGGGLYSDGALNLSNVHLLSSTARRAGGAYIAGALNAIDTTWQNNQCSAQRGGAFEVYGAATLNGGLLEGNRCAYGGGLFANTALAISGTHFISNTATSPSAGSGGAIYAAGAATLINARFERNTSYTGGGAVLHSGADPLAITSTTFISNTALNASAQGGALYASGPVATIHDSAFQGNQVPGEGGAIVAFRAITLTNTSLISNTAGKQGGAIYHWGLSDAGDTSQIYPLVMSDTVLMNNSASSEGGALYFRRGFAAANVPVQIHLTSLLSNTAVFSGGAVYLGQPSVIADSIVQSNASLSAAGGGLFAEDALEMARTTVQGNTASRASGAYLKGTLATIDTTWLNNQCSVQRGGAFEVYGNATVIGGRLEGNQCYYAGGIFADAALSISGTHFISNTAASASAGSGGAIYADGTLTLIDARFERNASYTGAGAVLHSGTEPLAITGTTFISNTVFNASAQGGALYASGATATIHDSLFQGNTAPGSSGAGGAIVGFQAMTLTHVTLISNTAGQHGGAIYHWGLNESGNTSQIQPLIISNTILMNNTANGEGGALYFRRGFAAVNTPVQIDHASFRSNTALLRGGALYLGQPSLIARSEFRDNVSSLAGGGLFAQDSVTVKGVTFAHNTAATDGGAVRLSVQPGSISRVENSVFADNQAAGSGAAISIIAGKSIEIVHSTLAGGSLNPKQAIYAAGSAVHITNTIIASHTVGIERGNLATVTAQRNLFFGNTLDITGSVTNTSPIAGEPRFIDPASDDYHLSLGSAALDAGLNLNLSTDFEDDLRFIGAGVDVGADEFGDAALIGGGQTTQIGVQPRPGQQISITIPPGAGGGTGVIHLLPIITPTRPLPPRRSYANLGFTLQTQPGGGLRLANAETFLEPITIELRYTDADVAGMNEAALDLLVWDEIRQIWITAQESCASPMSPVRQAGSNTLIVSTCAEGEFALAGGPYQLYLPVIFNSP